MTKLECLIGLLNTIPLNNIKTSLPLELLHHFKYLTIASVNKDLIYLTIPSGHPFDACFVDKPTETIMSTFEFKFVEKKIIITLERWLSGLKHWFAKPTYESAPWVRIPSFPFLGALSSIG